MKFKYSLNFVLLLTIAILLCPAISRATGLENTIERITACGKDANSVNRLLAAVLDRRITKDDAAIILKPILEICEQGYPVKIYFRKMDEGLGKRIPGPLIIAALKKMHDNFSSIHKAVSGNADTPVKAMVISATDAANAGVQIDFITRWITKYKGNLAPKTLTTAFLTAKALAGTGFEQSRIDKIVSAGLESGTIDDSWKYISRVVSASRSKGISDSDLTSTAVRILKKNGTLADFLVALGFSERNIKQGK